MKDFNLRRINMSLIDRQIEAAEAELAIKFKDYKENRNEISKMRVDAAGKELLILKREKENEND